MSKAKKYDFRIIKDNNTWTAEIIRQVTSKRTVVSKSQTGFATEAKAQAWAQDELPAFLKNLNERNKRRAEKRD
ncbi:MAG: DUF3622 domain-containing protein [Gammaproteobacteria bacterium]|nr:DUF3622 domain-containing protein [Gammaproteobacteria bacterium]